MHLVRGRTFTQSLHMDSQNALGTRQPKATLELHNIVIGSTHLQLHVLDTLVKRGAELSTDYHLVVSWWTWWQA